MNCQNIRASLLSKKKIHFSIKKKKTLKYPKVLENRFFSKDSFPDC